MTHERDEKNGILLLTNFMVDMGIPGFRSGTYQNYLLPLAKSLGAECPASDIRVLISTHALEELRRFNRPGRTIGQKDFVVDPVKRFDLFGSGDAFVERAYSDSFSQLELDGLEKYFRGVFGNFEPSTIICWEFPINFLRRIFPSAVVIDLMPGTFMRPPYPKTVAVDPWGIYKNSGLRDLLSGKIRPTDAEVRHHIETKDHYSEFFQECRAREKILSLFKDTARFTSFKLVPLQISSYFGFHANCTFRSQFDFLLHVLQNTASDVGVIATQYTGSLTSENSINAGNVDFLRKNFDNFLYSERFDLASNISQYIVPWADETCSVSSTLGLQANFHNRRLTSPSTSHLAFLQDDLMILPPVEAAALIQSRYSLSWEKLLSEKGYFRRIIDHLHSIKESPDHSPYGEWPLSAEPLFIKKDSIFKRASEILAQIGPLKGPFPDNVFQSIARESINSAQTVSFDVFDTLVTRPVYLPADIFLFIGCHLQDNYPDLLPPFISPSLFARFRHSAEQVVRRGRDAALKMHGNTLPEEISIYEIYQELVTYIPGLDHQSISELVAIESEIELSLIGPIPMGVELFRQAKAAGKRLFIISDFCHPKKFVEDCLKKAGVEGYEHCYVSSDSGPKKHSGGLYHLVATNHQIPPGSWLHIGDNPEGDIRCAREAGVKALRFPNFRKVVADNLTARGIPGRHFRPSFPMRTAVSLFAQKFTPCSETTENRNIFESREQLGYLGLGPLILSFATWVAETALAKGCAQVVFFARDCHLPSLTLQKLAASDSNFANIRSFYVPASRSGVKGFNFYQPSDVFKVSLNDFAGVSTVAEALWQRFGINASDIAPELYQKHGIPNSGERFQAVQQSAIYSLVYEQFTNNWTQLSAEFTERRNRYKKMLAASGIDTNLPTALVDIGYSGTITKAVQGLFDAPTAALFMMTFASDLGKDPIENCEAFLGARQRQGYSSSSPFLKHNLIFETLLNEPTGSLIQVFENEGSAGADVIKEPLPSSAHSRSVSDVHTGVNQFVDDWLGQLGHHGHMLRFEQNVLLMTLHKVFADPTIDEARLLADLIFDNGYAGYEARNIASSGTTIWKAGEKALIEEAPYATKEQDPPPPQPKPREVLKIVKRRKVDNTVSTSMPARKISTQSKKIEPSAFGKIFIGAVIKVVTLGSNEKVRQLAKNDPARFLTNSKSALLRGTGVMIFGQNS